MDSAGHVIVPGNCIKCKTKPSSINVRYAVYCEECFLDQAYHKYRLSVAKSKTSVAPERILLAYSKGNSSHVLLHFSQLARLRDPRRQNLDQYQVVHIWVPGEESLLSLIDASLTPYNIICQHIPLASALFEGEASEEEAQRKLDRLLAACTAQTSRVDLLRILHRMALVRSAAKHNCSKVYVGDTCSRLAIDIMAFTCTGRGEALPWLLSQRQRYLPEGIEVIRPLRELIALEIDHCINLIRPHYPPPVHLEPGVEKKSPESIYELTERFIGELDRENSATVSTVARTAAKLQTTVSEMTSWRPCALCVCPLGDDAVAASVLCHGCHDIIEAMSDDFDASLLPSSTRTSMQSCQ